MYQARLFRSLLQHVLAPWRRASDVPNPRVLFVHIFRISSVLHNGDQSPRLSWVRTDRDALFFQQGRGILARLEAGRVCNGTSRNPDVSDLGLDEVNSQAAFLNEVKVVVRRHSRWLTVWEPEATERISLMPGNLELEATPPA